MRLFISLIAISLLLKIAPAAAQTPASAATTEISGTVLADSGEPLPGATVFLQGTYLGSTTSADGTFRLAVPGTALPAALEVSFVGYETARDTIREARQNLRFVLRASSSLINEVVVSASRGEESLLRTGSTVEKLNTTQLARLTQPDLLSGLARLKGVDATTSGLFMTSLSTRGFNAAASPRLVQLVDYMDTQSPSLNISTGNSLGLPEVDIASVEVLHGPSSALYGANAFDGVVLTTSKDPFKYEGLSVRLRGGNRDYLDGQLRYALRLGQKAAFKVSGSFAQANDFMADNFAPQSAAYVLNNNAQGSGLGYDAINRYGDIGTTFGATGGALNGKTVFMPGWTEAELIAGDQRGRLYRVVPSFHYLLTDKVKAMVEFKRAESTTSSQFSNRYRLKNFGTNQYRAELKADNWFVRAYQTQDFGADSYDLLFTGSFMQTAVDPRPGANGRTFAQQYFQTYATVYNTFLAQNPGNLAGAEQAAQAAAAGVQLVPGTPAFEAVRQAVITDATPGRGSRINPSSLLNEVAAHYDFKTPVVHVAVGGSYRQFRLGSDGLLFSDRNGKRIRNDEYGGYVQLSKALLQERLKLTFAGRLDESKNFEPVFSPRSSVVYSVGANKQHNFRGSYNQAFRSPTQQGQYLSLDLSRALLLGNIGDGFSGYSPAVAAQLGRILASPATAQAELDVFALRAERLKPERVQAWEVGYKGEIVPNVVLDVNYYRSRYNDFIGQIRLIGNTDGTRPTVAEMASAAQSPQPFQAGPTRVIQVQANANQEVRTSGGLAAVSFTPLKELNLTANYTLNLLNDNNLPDDFQSFFNTPKHKFNAGAYGELAKRLTYSLNYRWAEGHLFESPFAAGELGDYSSLDAQLGYRLPTLHSTLQIGGSNLANARNIQVFGGPQISRLVYAGLQFELN